MFGRTFISGWLLSIVLASTLSADSAALRQAEEAKANAKRAAGQKWWYYYRVGTDHWPPEYHPERKGRVSILYFMKWGMSNSEDYQLYLTRSHKYRAALEGLPQGCYVVFRYSEKPQQQEGLYSAAYLIPLKYAPVRRGGKPGQWKAIH